MLLNGLNKFPLRFVLLAKEQRKLAKASAAHASKERASQADSLKAAVRQLKNERPPTNVEERESYFLEQVAIGEALAAKGMSCWPLLSVIID